MKKISAEAEKIMVERFGKDTVIALATVENGVPYVRSVNAYYENGAFYIITPVSKVQATKGGSKSSLYRVDLNESGICSSSIREAKVVKNTCWRT